MATTQQIISDPPVGATGSEVYRCAIDFADGNGLAQDLPRAARLFQRAVDECSHVISMFQLGKMLADGVGVSKDSKRAAELYQRAIDEGGHVIAMFYLAEMYEKGAEQVPRDLKRAKELYSRAANHSQHQLTVPGQAMSRLAGILERGGDGVARDFKQAAQWYERRVERDSDVDARRRLAHLLWQDGEGLSRNLNSAIEHLQVVVDAEHQEMDVRELRKWQRVRTAEENEEDIEYEYDMYISHAGPEKDIVAKPLMRVLVENGMRCFLDDESLVGSNETAKEQMEKAMRASRAAVFILSLDFASRRYPMIELRTFIKLVEEAKAKNRKAPLLIPLFYKMKPEQCRYNHLLSDTDAFQTFKNNYFFEANRQRECTLADVMDALGKLSEYVGIRNDEELEGREYALCAARDVLRYFERAYGPVRTMQAAEDARRLHCSIC